VRLQGGRGGRAGPLDLHQSVQHRRTRAACRALSITWEQGWRRPRTAGRCGARPRGQGGGVLSARSRVSRGGRRRERAEGRGALAGGGAELSARAGAVAEDCRREALRPKTEDRRPKTEDRRPKTEAEDRSRRPKVTPQRGTHVA